MKKKSLALIAAIVVIIGGLIMVRLLTVSPIQPTHNNANSEYVIPGVYPNKINNSNTRPGLVISQVAAENNVDGSGKAVSDHLQLKLVNTTGTEMSNIEVYYTLMDTKTGQKEGYYTPLTGLSIPAKSSTDINFDNGTDAGHYPANKNGMFYSGKNDVTIQVEVSAKGYAPQHTTVTKSAGGSDRVD